MRNIIALLFVWSWFTFQGYSQDSVTYKPQYKPETKYIQTIENNNFILIKFSGSDEFLQKMVAKGFQNPTIKNSNSKIDVVTKTGKLTNNSNFPLKIEFLRMKSNESQKSIPNGIILYGHSSNENLPSMDSIVSIGLKEEYKTLLLQVGQNILDEFVSTEKTVRIGESFSVDTQLSMPILNMTVEMNVNTNYKLENIKNGIANFKLSLTYIFKSSVTKYNVNGIGNGEGQLDYDISNKYNLKYQIFSHVKIIYNFNDYSVDYTSDNNIIRTNIISKY